MGFTKKDREQRTESGIRWGLKDPESGEEAQTRGRPAQILEMDRFRDVPKREKGWFRKWVERKEGFTKKTAMRHRRVGGRAVTVTAMLHRQRYRVIEKGKD